MEDIVNVISTLGFPIATSIAIFYFAIKFVEAQVKQYSQREQNLIEAYKANEDRYAKQLDKFAESLNNFNITLTKIDSRLAWLEEQLRKNNSSTEQ
jgi:hypothetical protein